MADRYLELYSTPDVLNTQEEFYGRARPASSNLDRDKLRDEESDFIAQRDSFYMATVNRDGWPYLQHRGGPAGFLKVMDSHSLAFADFKGNRQLLSMGNLSTSNKVALFLMDYPNRARLKILGTARVEDARDNPDWVARFAEPEDQRVVERVFFIDVISYDWNCPKYITPRYSQQEIQQQVEPLKNRISELEHQLGLTTNATSHTEFHDESYRKSFNI